MIMDSDYALKNALNIVSPKIAYLSLMSIKAL